MTESDKGNVILDLVLVSSAEIMKTQMRERKFGMNL